MLVLKYVYVINLKTWYWMADTTFSRIDECFYFLLHDDRIVHVGKYLYSLERVICHTVLSVVYGRLLVGTQVV